MFEEPKSSPFIFFLMLGDILPKSYFVFDKLFREYGFVLVPVKMDQLQQLASAAEQGQLIFFTSTLDAKEYRQYNERIRPLLKYVLKSRRITFLHISSFKRLDDSTRYIMAKNYFFLKYPLDARILVARVARYYEFKSAENSKWPGGKRGGLHGVRFGEA
jgi:hypothetical protein